MPEIQSIGTQNIVLSKGPQKKEAEAPKQAINFEENGAKIMTGLTALGAIALAGVAIAKGKGKKATEAAQEATEAIQRASQKTATEIAKEATEKAQARVPEAIEALKKGGNYAKVKNEATKNLTRNGKKIVKSEIKKVRAERLAVEKAQQESSKLAKKVSEKANGVAKNMNQGIGKAGIEEVSTRIANSKQAVKQAEAAAQVAKDIAEQNPTKSNKMWAKRAENTANEVKKQAKKVEINGEKRISEIGNEMGRKKESRAAMMASPNYEAGLEKQARNAEKANKNATKRQARKDMAKPGYQRALKEYQNKNADQLTAIINDKNKSNIEKKVAEDLLANL